MSDPARLVCDVGQLVTLPEVAMRVTALVEDPEATIDEIAQTIAGDPALTARLLTLANSASFGRGRAVTTIARAVSVTGIDAVRNLTLGLSVARVFDRIPNELVTMESFWHSSLLTAVAARNLADAGRCGAGDVVFVAGLLHDVGQLVIFGRHPDEARRALEDSIYEAAEPPLYLCERNVLGFDHAQVGDALAAAWNLPAQLRECIACHHEPARARGFPVDAAIVHIANSLAVLAEIDSRSWDDAPAVDALAWERTRLDPGAAAALIEQTRAQAEELRELFR